jgi:hypothetical protein
MGPVAGHAADGVVAHVADVERAVAAAHDPEGVVEPGRARAPRKEQAGRGRRGQGQELAASGGGRAHRGHAK